MAAAVVVQLAAGLGLSMVAVPPLVALDPRFVPGPLLAVGAVLMFGQWRADVRAVPRGILPWAVAGLAVGTALGMGLAAVAPQMASRRGFGVVILLAVLLAVTVPRLRPVPPMLFAAGFISGAMGGFSGVHGPLMALAVAHLPAQAVRGVLGLFWLIAYAMIVPVAAIAGRFGAAEGWLTLMLLPGLALGVLLARPARAWLTGPRLRPAILLVSTVSGGLLVWFG